MCRPGWSAWSRWWPPKARRVLPASRCCRRPALWRLPTGWARPWPSTLPVPTQAATPLTCSACSPAWWTCPSTASTPALPPSNAPTSAKRCLPTRRARGLTPPLAATTPTPWPAHRWTTCNTPRRASPAPRRRSSLTHGAARASPRGTSPASMPAWARPTFSTARCRPACPAVPICATWSKPPLSTALPACVAAPSWAGGTWPATTAQKKTCPPKPWSSRRLTAWPAGSAWATWATRNRRTDRKTGMAASTTWRQRWPTSYASALRRGT